jgi:hypothetical protein
MKKPTKSHNDVDFNRRQFLSTSAKVVATATVVNSLSPTSGAQEVTGPANADLVSQKGSPGLVDPALLVANGVDVAGVITDTFLNNFSDAHFKKGNEIYKGSYEISDFESKLRIFYEFAAAIKFDLSPIPPNRFQSIWISHLKTKGSPNLAEVPMVPPNLMLSGERVKFRFTVYKGQTNDEDFSVDFEWSLEARCAVLLVEVAGGERELRLEPIKVKFTKSPEQLSREIAERVALIAQTRGPSRGLQNGRFGNPADPEWCIKLEKLFLFLVNQVLAISMTNFIKTWRLPRAIDLIKGVAVSPSYLEIANKMMIVGGQVLYAPSRVSPIAERVTEFMESFSEKLQEEIETLTDEQLEKWDPNRSPSFQFLRQREKQILAEFNELANKSKNTSKSYPDNVQILSNDKLFDALAKAYLKDERRKDYSTRIDFIVKGEAGWWLKVDGGYGRVVPSGVKIGANIAVGGYARACAPNPDPKHWGEWSCIGLCVQIEPKPNFEIDAFPDFKSSGIHIRLVLRTQRIEASLCGGIPSWVNKIVRWITGVLSEPLLDVIRALIALFNFKVVDYPKYFPGTAIGFEPRFNSRAQNAGPYLAFTADPKFKA